MAIVRDIKDDEHVVLGEVGLQKIFKCNSCNGFSYLTITCESGQHFPQFELLSNNEAAVVYYYKEEFDPGYILVSDYFIDGNVKLMITESDFTEVAGEILVDLSMAMDWAIRFIDLGELVMCDQWERL